MTNYLSLLNGTIKVNNFKEGTEVLASVSPKTQELIQKALSTDDATNWKNLITVNENKKSFITIEFETNLGNIEVKYYFSKKVNMLEGLVKHIGRYDASMNGSVEVSALEYLAKCTAKFPLVYGFNNNNYLGWLHTTLTAYNYKRSNCSEE